jgi:hypothetical protein
MEILARQMSSFTFTLAAGNTSSCRTSIGCPESTSERLRARSEDREHLSGVLTNVARL